MISITGDNKEQFEKEQQESLYDFSNVVKQILSNGIIKPTIEQVAWVFRQIMDNAGKGTFRYLIYDRMGFKEEAYLPLYEAGGLAINNAMFEIYNEKECNKELNIVTEDDGSRWVSLEDYNKLRRELSSESY